MSADGQDKPIDPNLEAEWSPGARVLDAEGNMSGPAPASPDAPRAAAPATRDGLPTLSSLKTGDLELVRDPHDRPERRYEEPEPYREVVVRSRKKPALVALGLAALGAAGLFAFYKSPRLATTVNVHVRKGPLVISSEPSGAELWLAGKKVGNTPWATDNDYTGKVPYEVRLEGYRPATGTFFGGEETHLDLALEPD